MIEHIEVSNYRSCLKTSFVLQPDLSVLIGPNGSGKTNILNAILLLRSLTADRASRREIDEQVSESVIKAAFSYEDKKITFTARINLLSDENNDDLIVGAKQSWSVKDFTNSAKRIDLPLSVARALSKTKEQDGITMLSTGDDDYFIEYSLGTAHFVYPARDLKDVPEALLKAMGKIATFLGDIKYYSASQFTNPSLCPVSFEVEQEGQRRRTARVRGHANSFRTFIVPDLVRVTTNSLVLSDRTELGLLIILNSKK